MEIQKIGHSCLLLEKSGKRLLIDPGAWAFKPIGTIEPEELGAVDVILFTHEHQDHFSVEHLKRIIAIHQPRIISHARIAELLAKEHIACEAIAAGQEITAEGFRIKGVRGDHGEIPATPPVNLGYLVNETLFHPGDSITFDKIPCAVFAMPLAAPWMRLKDALEVAALLKPQIVIPIHDAFIKDFFLDRMHAMATSYLAEKGIMVRSLKSGEKLEV